MNDPTPQHPAIKNLETYLKEGWEKYFSKLIQKLVTVAFTIAIFIAILFIAINQVKLALLSEKEGMHPNLEDNQAKPNDKGETPVLLGVSDCVTADWGSFNEKDWVGISWFSISNNVWTIRSPETEKDAAAYYNSNCIGGSLVEYQVIPLIEDFLNINVYQRGQLRWEIGGGDRRSIRLWKNVTGCGTGEIKNAILIKEAFIPKHDEILINQPLVIHSAIFYLANGLIRNEIWLTYSSKNQNGEVVTTPRGEYFYDFEAGPVCDPAHFPDINLESYQTGIGLQSKKTLDENQTGSFPLPRVNFDKFRILPFSNTN